MSDADAFGANPFRALNAKKFPEKQKNGGNERKPAHHGQGKGKRVIASAGTAQAAEISDEDCDLFLNAVSSVTPAKNSRKAANPGFSLEERGTMTSMADALAEERGKGKKNAAKGGAQDAGKPKGAALGTAQIPGQTSSGKVPSGSVNSLRWPEAVR